MQTDNNRRHRYRWSCQILYEHYTEFMNCQRLKNEIAAERGWSLATFWIATAGGLNEFFLEREYESLGQLAVELEARDTDIDFMREMRTSYKYVVQGSVPIELFESPKLVE